MECFKVIFFLFQVKPDGYYTLLKQVGTTEVKKVKSYVSLWLTNEKKRKSSTGDDQLKSLFENDTIEMKVINYLLSTEDVTSDEVSFCI